MKKHFLINVFVFLLLVLTLETSLAQKSKKFEPNWESLKEYQVPDWFRDAKLGIFIHWGPYAVPAYETEWYGFHMYREKQTNPKGIPSENPSRIYKHHLETYGPLSKFGYKDFIPMFTGENFDAKEWLDLFEEAGAKYVVPVGEHCDRFAMYDSKITDWNSVKMGPKVDVVGELFKESRKRGLKTGVSSHFAYGWYWWEYKEGYDTMDPKYKGLYGEAHDFSKDATPKYINTFYKRTLDMIDNYQPDLLWFDFGFCRPEYEETRKKLLAYYYNEGAKRDQEVVLNYKNINYKPIPDGAAVLDLESGKLDRIREMPWQTDASLGSRQWGWSTSWVTRPASEVVADLVDIVSKNGCLLLNIGPDAQGNISDDQVACLKEIGAWLKLNGEGIYDTRPFAVFGQGPSNAKMVLHGSFNHDDRFSSEDIRYTQNGQNVYAYMMQWKKGQKVLSLNALGTEQHIINDDIKEVTLLATGEKLKWIQTGEALIIELPKKAPNDHAIGFKIILKDAPTGIF